MAQLSFTLRWVSSVQWQCFSRPAICLVYKSAVNEEQPGLHILSAANTMTTDHWSVFSYGLTVAKCLNKF